MFVQPRDEPALVETGDNLGAINSGLKRSQFIEEYVSGVPKNYAYKIDDSATGERNRSVKLEDLR